MIETISKVRCKINMGEKSLSIIHLAGGLTSRIYKDLRKISNCSLNHQISQQAHGLNRQLLQEDL